MRAEARRARLLVGVARDLPGVLARRVMVGAAKGYAGAVSVGIRRPAVEFEIW